MFLACGAGHPNIQSIQVNPQQAQASSPRGEVGFTAMGIFSNNDSRELTVADGTDLGAQKLERVLTNDPGTGVMRHADAGYDRAIGVASERGVRIPMRG